jgi:hypothetical protein
VCQADTIFAFGRVVFPFQITRDGIAARVEAGLITSTLVRLSTMTTIMIVVLISTSHIFGDLLGYATINRICLHNLIIGIGREAVYDVSGFQTSSISVVPYVW